MSNTVGIRKINTEYRPIGQVVTPCVFLVLKFTKKIEVFKILQQIKTWLAYFLQIFYFFSKTLH